MCIAEGQEDISRLAHAEVRLHGYLLATRAEFYDLASRRTLISEPISTRDTSVSQGFPPIPIPSLSTQIRVRSVCQLKGEDV